MPVTELRCTSCNAPIEGEPTSGVIRCRYCGVTLVVAREAPSPAASSDDEPPRNVHTEYVLRLARVGPSNRPRIEKHVVEYARVSAERAAELVAHAPCEISLDTSEDRAYALKRAIVDDGGQADVDERMILGPAHPATALLPNVSVVLDEVGSRKITVIKVLREYFDVDLANAKRIVDSAPCVLARSMEGGRARRFCEELVAAGAKAHVS